MAQKKWLFGSTTKLNLSHYTLKATNKQTNKPDGLPKEILTEEIRKYSEENMDKSILDVGVGKVFLKKERNQKEVGVDLNT